jgi:hypothetical protein
MTATATRVLRMFCTTTAGLPLTTATGRYELEESDDGSYFFDRDGSVIRERAGIPARRCGGCSLSIDLFLSLSLSLLERETREK